MAEFRMTIGRDVAARHPSKAWQRMVRYVEDRAESMVQYDDFAKDAWVVKGNGPVEVATVLQAAARGDDLDAVIDALEARPGYAQETP